MIFIKQLFSKEKVLLAETQLISVKKIYNEKGL